MTGDRRRVAAGGTFKADTGWLKRFNAGMLALWLSGEGRKNNMPYGIAYSFDMLLPIIRLREKHYKIDLQGWVRYYFYVHRIMGFVLASFPDRRDFWAHEVTDRPRPCFGDTRRHFQR